jgi:hypothetical protein
MPVDAILQRLALEDVLHVPGRLLVALAAHRDRPRIGVELPHAHRRRVLVDAELVIVVVSGDVFPAVRFVDLLVDAERAGLHILELAPVRRGCRGLQPDVGSDDAECRRRHGAASSLDELPAIEIPLLIGDLGAANVCRAFDQHKSIIRGRSGRTPAK